MEEIVSKIWGILFTKMHKNAQKSAYIQQKDSLIRRSPKIIFAVFALRSLQSAVLPKDGHAHCTLQPRGGWPCCF